MIADITLNAPAVIFALALIAFVVGLIVHPVQRFTAWSAWLLVGCALLALAFLWEKVS